MRVRERLYRLGGSRRPLRLRLPRKHIRQRQCDRDGPSLQCPHRQQSPRPTRPCNRRRLSIYRQRGQPHTRCTCQRGQPHARRTCQRGQPHARCTCQRSQPHARRTCQRGQPHARRTCQRSQPHARCTCQRGQQPPITCPLRLHSVDDRLPCAWR